MRSLRPVARLISGEPISSQALLWTEGVSESATTAGAEERLDVRLTWSRSYQ